jgi:hypothetical protein
MKKTIVLLVLCFATVAGAISVENGAINVITYFSMRDQTTGTIDTGIVIGNLEMYYIEDQSAESADVFSQAHGSATDAHTDGECIHVGHGNYRVDWPDAAFDGGIHKRVQLILVDGDGGAFTETLEVELSPPVDANTVSGGEPIADTRFDNIDNDNATAQADLDTITGADGVVIATNAITATSIAGDAITEAKIANNAIAAEHIAANAIGASELATDAIGSDELAATAVDEIWEPNMVDMPIPDPGPDFDMSVFDAINLIFEIVRNRSTIISDELTFYKDNATTPWLEANLADDGNYDRQELRKPD